MKQRSAAFLIVIGLVLQGIGVHAQSAAQTSWVGDIEIAGLAPFQISLRFTYIGDASIATVSGRATLTDQSGQRLEELDVGPFQAPVGVTTTAFASSRWDVQQPGTYLLEVALDDGGTVLRTRTLPFRILPIPLPLDPSPAVGDRDLYTVYQEPTSWGLVRVSAPEAWTITHGSDDVVVAVIDAGVDWSVSQVAGSLWTNPGEIAGNGKDDDRNGYVDDLHGWDFRDNDSGPLEGTPIHAHGTVVASIIAARPGNVPIVGIAPGVRIMDVRFLDSNNGFRSADWTCFVEAIEYAVDNGADIINLSIYSNGRPPTVFEAALQRAVDQGVIVVGITGNEGKWEVMYPAKYDSVLAVSAVSETGLLAGFSNRGAEVAVCAPGESIPALARGGIVSTYSGTSFAAPHVAGILALILSAEPGISAERAISILRQSAVDLGSAGEDDLYGDGFVNALTALSLLGR